MTDLQLTHNPQLESPLEVLQDPLENMLRGSREGCMPNDPSSPSSTISVVRRPRKNFWRFFYQKGNLRVDAADNTHNTKDIINSPGNLCRSNNFVFLQLQLMF